MNKEQIKYLEYVKGFLIPDLLDEQLLEIRAHVDKLLRLSEKEHKYKKYIVFAYPDYYPSGALGDIDKSFATIEEAKEYTKDYLADNVEIIDRDTWEEVE